MVEGVGSGPESHSTGAGGGDGRLVLSEPNFTEN